MGLAWGNQLSVGNAVIDSDHKYLMGMINAIKHAISAGSCSGVSKGFESLENWLCIHFENEKKIARAINFDFSSHKQAQQYSIKELQHLKNELLAKKGIWCESAIEHYSKFLDDWMMEHIVKVDKPMQPMLQAHDYKFWPGQFEGEVNYIAGHTASLYLRILDGPRLSYAIPEL